MRQVIESRVHANGLELALYDWPAGGPTVFFAHATGFHARCWDQIIERLPGLHCVALDMRGHGRSEKPAPPYAWRNFAIDVAEVGRQLGFRDVLAVGHSKGGYAITLAAAIEPALFGKLLLIDPVILPRDAYLTRREGEHFAARRRNRWSSAQEMYDRFANRPPFNAWDPATLRDYCQYGLLPAPDGDGFVLACSPEIEAATYAASGGEAIYDQIANLRIPVRVMRAKGRMDPAQTDMSSSPTAPDLASHFFRGEDVPLPQYSHFIPMEAPALVAEHVREMAATDPVPT